MAFAASELTHTSSIVVTMLSSSSPSGAASPALSLPPPPVVVLVLATPVAVWRILTVSAAVGWPEDDGTTSSLPTGVGVVDDDPLRTGGWEETTLVSPAALHNIHSCGLNKSLCSRVSYSLTQLNREL